MTTEGRVGDGTVGSVTLWVPGTGHLIHIVDEPIKPTASVCIWSYSKRIIIISQSFMTFLW